MDLFLVVIIAAMLGVSATAYAAELTGVLVDKACYTKDKANTTNAHKGMGETCAQACAKNDRAALGQHNTGGETREIPAERHFHHLHVRPAGALAASPEQTTNDLRPIPR